MKKGWFVGWMVTLLMTLGMATAAQPLRIISLAPSITELLYAVGAGPEIVAVDSASDYPPQVKRLAVIGGYQSLNIEAIVALHPTWVVVWQGGNSPQTIAELKRLHIPVFAVAIQRLPDIATALRTLGRLTGHSAQGEQAADLFLARLTALQQQGQAFAKTHAPVRVMVEEANDPLYVATGNSLQSQVVSLCGGVNVFQHLPGLAQAVTVEGVLQANPQLIIGLSPVSLQSWQAWPMLSAVSEHRLYTINGDLLARNGPRIVEGIQQVCAWIQR